MASISIKHKCHYKCCCVGPVFIECWSNTPVAQFWILLCYLFINSCFSFILGDVVSSVWHYLPHSYLSHAFNKKI